MRILFWAAVAACTLWAYTKVHTYATGQDPKTYLLLAKRILKEGLGGGDGWLVVPGWPLVLAGVMKVCGVHAAFWTNIPLFALLVAALGALAGRLSRDWTRGAVVAAGSALLMLGGSPYNPHFLLWVFRQTPVYLASTLALLCLERAVSRRAAGKPGRAAAWLGGSLLWVVAGEFVRETGALILPAMGLYLLADALGWIGPAGAVGKGRGRWLLVGLFAGTLAAGAAALAAAWALGLVRASGQVGYMMGFLPNLFNRSSPLLEMMGWIPSELGWIGFAALLWGVVLSVRRRNRGYLLLFLVPALSYLLFDGMLKAHRRFFMSTLFFLSPVAMLGACEAAGAAWRAARRAMARAEWPAKWRRRAWMAGRAAVWAALAAWSARVVGDIGPWGVQARRGDVKRALEVISPWVADGRPILVDGRARFLTDVLEVFTDWDVRAVDRENAESCVQEPPLAFVQPLNELALHWAATGLPANRLLSRWAHLEDVPDSGFRLGMSRYRLRWVERWSEWFVQYKLPPPPESAMLPQPPYALLRLDVPESAAAKPLRVTLGERVLAERLEPGYQFLSVPRAWLDSADENGVFVLRVAADGPIPDVFRPVWLHPDMPLEMEFGARRVPSAVAYLSEEFRRFDHLSGLDREFPYWPAPGIAREFGGDGDVRLPEGVWAAGADYLVELTLTTLHNDPEGRLAVTVSVPEFPEVAPATDRKPFLAHLQPFNFKLANLPRPPRVLHIHAEREVDFPKAILGNPRHANLQLGKLAVRVLRDVESLHIRVGNTDDGVLLRDGFHGREQANSPKHGRWTKGRTLAYLPITGGKDYRLEVNYSQYRPDEVPRAVPTVSLNGQVLESEVTDSGLVARIPAGLLAEPNLLLFETDTWNPARHGMADDRELGVYMRDIRVVPF
ncbi:MAG: hypothetical protein IKQ55_10435 [Kiritimatiellae bacterium]|nr:hypothetical protein [Kiritimatiellia bacterium]